MEIRQCMFCNMPFQSYGGQICTNCLMQLDIDVNNIRDYLEKPENRNKSIGVDEISKNTEVPKKRILFLLKENRLMVKNLSEEDGVFCEMCGASIEYGKMCDSCKATLAAGFGLNQSAPNIKPSSNKPSSTKSSGGMHVHQSNRDRRF